MRLILDQWLAAGFIPINTWQQRTSLPLKPSVLEWKVYNNDYFTSRAATHYHTRAWQTLIYGKECSILLMEHLYLVKWDSNKMSLISAMRGFHKTKNSITTTDTEMTTYKLKAYSKILKILYVCLYYNMLKLLWIKYCLNQQLIPFLQSACPPPLPHIGRIIWYVTG